MKIYNTIFIIIISFLVSNILNILYIINYIFFRKDKYFKEIISNYYKLNLLNFITYYIIISKFNFTIETLLYSLLFSMLILISFIDIKYKIVPDKTFIFFIILAFINILFSKEINILNILYGSIIISLPLFIITIVTKGFGGGDIKLYFFLGFLLGLEKIILSFVISIIVAGIYSIFLLIKYKNNTKKFIPFVPFIYIGTLISIILNK